MGTTMTSVRLGNEDDIILLRRWQQAIAAQLVTRFADGTHNRDRLSCGVMHPGQIDDLVISTIQRRADQRVHAGTDTDIAHIALALGLRYAAE